MLLLQNRHSIDKGKGYRQEEENAMLSKVEVGCFLKLFINNGFVLDFSNSEFDVFTMESIGIPIQTKYQLSKGASLTKYCNEADPEDVTHLLSDLLTYYELECLTKDLDKTQRNRYDKCKALINRETRGLSIVIPAVNKIDREYIHSIALRANKDIDDGNYDSAITKSRTLLEEVFCYVIEAKEELPSNKGDISKLYAQVKDLYNMHASKEIDARINSLLSGLEKILKSITEMRNESSDSHGIGVRRVSIRDYHARLFVNAALTMADFILSVEHNANGNEK